MNARVIRNTPIFVLLVISFSLHGIALLWSEHLVIPKPSTIATDSGIHVRLNANKLDKTDLKDKPESTEAPAHSQPKIAKLQRSAQPVKPVKSLPAEKVQPSLNADQALPSKAPEAVKTVKRHSVHPVTSTAKVTASADSESQQLKIRIQQLIKLRVSHNQYYPRIARNRAWEGQVKLGMQVRSDGQLTDVHVISSSGHRVLDRAAMKSIRVVTVLPEAIDWLQGRSIDVILPIIYKLTDS